MTDKDIKPIPKYIVELIRKEDKKANVTPKGRTRFYAYLAIWKKELVKVTVAVKYHYSKWIYKQVAVHGVHSDLCWVKDMVFYYISGYHVGWYEEGIHKTPKWYESPEWGCTEDKYFDPYAPIVNRDIVSKLPEYKYSAHELFKGVELLQYLRTYEKYPQVEYLMKLGLSCFAKSKQILVKMGKDKKFCKWLAQHRAELTATNYYISAVIKAYNKKLNLPQTQAYEEAKKRLGNQYDYSRIKRLFEGRLNVILDYIGKHATNLSTYNDYLTACEYLGLDLSLDKNLLPHDFKRWHDIRIDEYATSKAMKDQAERQALYEKFALVAEKYLPLQHDKRNKFICIIAKSPADLIREGEILQHCVGRMGYDQKFSREETLIFFIRERSTPDTPLVTVEYSIQGKKILQCYGEKDSKPNPSILHYVNDIWLPYANKHINQIAA